MANAFFLEGKMLLIVKTAVRVSLAKVTLEDAMTIDIAINRNRLISLARYWLGINIRSGTFLVLLKFVKAGLWSGLMHSISDTLKQS